MWEFGSRKPNKFSFSYNANPGVWHFYFNNTTSYELFYGNYLEEEKKKNEKMNGKISSSKRFRKKRVEYLLEGFVSKFDIRLETFTLCFTKIDLFMQKETERRKGREREWWSYIWKWIVHSNCWAFLNLSINLRHFSESAFVNIFFFLSKFFIYLSLAILFDFQVFPKNILSYQTFWWIISIYIELNESRFEEKSLLQESVTKKIKFLSIFCQSTDG